MRITNFGRNNAFLILSLLMAFICINFHEVGAVDSKRAPIILQHSFQTPFTVPNWIFQGSAYFRDHYIRLTPDRQSRIGGLWNAMPVQLESWEAVVEFKIHGQGRSGADGFAFWYVKEKSLGSLFGVDPSFEGLGLVVDTYDNDGSGLHPRLMVLISDGETEFAHNHNHEHAEGMERGGCAFPARQTGTTSFMKVTYQRGEKRLLVDVDHNDSGTWKSCANIENVDLPLGYFFGFTAATGQLADNHDLHSFYVTNLAGPDLPEIYNAEQYTLNGFQHTIEKRMSELQQHLNAQPKPTTTQHADQAPPVANTQAATAELDGHVTQLQTLIANVQKEFRAEVTALRTKLEQVSFAVAAAGSAPIPTSVPTTSSSSSSSSSFLSWSIVFLLILILIVLIRFQYQTKKELDKKLF